MRLITGRAFCISLHGGSPRYRCGLGTHSDHHTPTKMAGLIHLPLYSASRWAAAGVSAGYFQGQGVLPDPARIYLSSPYAFWLVPHGRLVARSVLSFLAALDDSSACESTSPPEDGNPVTNETANKSGPPSHRYASGHNHAGGSDAKPPRSRFEPQSWPSSRRPDRVHHGDPMDTRMESSLSFEMCPILWSRSATWTIDLAPCLARTPFPRRKDKRIPICMSCSATADSRL